MTEIKNIIDMWAKESHKNAHGKILSRHLSRVALYNLKGIDALYPDVKERYIKLKDKMRELGMPIQLSETFRTAEKQNNLFAQGRSTSGQTVTNAKGLESYHQYGLAFDAVFKTYWWRPPQWSWWEALGREGKKLGLTWGGSFGDMGHFEYHPGFNWKDLKPYFEK